MELSLITQLSEIAIKNHIPLSGQFELTPVCNLRCKMCYVHRPEEDKQNAGNLLPASFWLETARQMKEAGTLVLSMTGGETLLYPELDEVMDGLSSMGFLISFNTNGTLVDKERVQWFLKYVPTKINISLYGATNETYEKLCGMKDGFDRVDRAITLLQAAGLNVYLNAVIVPENRGELQLMHQYAARHGLVLHVTTYIFPNKSRCMGLSVKETDYRLNPEEAVDAFCENLSLVNGGADIHSKLAALSAQLAVMEQIMSRKENHGFEECRGGLCDFAVTWKGKLQPCVMFDRAAVELRREDKTQIVFLNSWNEMSEKMSHLQAPKRCKECHRQMICPGCKAAIYQESGNLNEAPEYLCQYCDVLEEMARKEGEGIEISVSESISDCRDFYHSGCTE